jgi:LacI family transcriptional regulator
VKPETRELVERVSKRLRYRPNLAAVGLRSGRSSFVGIIVDHVGEESARMITAVEHCCREQGYHIALCIAGDDRDVAAEWIERNTYLDGAVFLRSGVHRVMWDRVGHIPSVYAYCIPSDGSGNTVFPDNTQGAYDAVQYLLTLGHRRIAFINGPSQWEAHVTRHQGWINALREAGQEESLKLLAQGDGSVESGALAFEQLLAGSLSPPTAVLACSDRMAVGVLRAAQARRLSVPGDLSVIGYENRELAQCTSPALTTVRLPFEEVAELAAYRLLQSLAQGTQREWPLLKVACELVIRESAGPPGRIK